MGTGEPVKIGSIGTVDEVRLALARAMEEIFATMFNEAASIIPHEEIKDAPRMTAIVGFAGRLSGLLCLHLSSAMACNIASGLLGMPVSHVDETVRDAIGEMSNMLAGGMKNHLSNIDNMFKIAIPSVIEGSEYTVHAPVDAHHLWMGVAAGKCRFKIQLVLQQQ